MFGAIRPTAHVGSVGFSPGGSMKVTDILRRTIGNIDSAARSLERVNDKLDALVAGCANETDLLNRKFDQVIAGLDNQSDLLNRKLSRLEGLFARGKHGNDFAAGVPNASVKTARESTLRETMQQFPLLLAERTYNTAHPNYDVRVVRNYPGYVFNRVQACENAAFQSLHRLMQGDQVPEEEWDAVLGETLVEAASVPNAEHVFASRSYIERYMNELGRKYRAHYLPGWVNLEDALFLYWMVRRLKPRTIVQTGVCNGLSTAFMMLGLAKNGPEGTLYAIDLPSVFDANDSAWSIEGKIYGFVIPEGKTSGWLVPEAYRGRLTLQLGDSRDLLPKVIDALDSIDLFYHDSDPLL
jgi:hypothetical protein